MDQNNYIFEVEDLCKYFPAGKKKVVKAVDGINLKIRKGETIGLVGESGCGKTTCGRTIIKLYEPTKGKILFEGKDVSKLHGKELLSFKKDVQVIFQDPYASLDPRMTIGEIISEGMHVHLKLSQKEMDERVADLLNKVGLNAEYANRFAHELSGGQRQRVGIARALAVEPKFIMCDEPISALDVSIQAQILNLLKDLQEKKKLTYVFVSHDMSVISHISDRVLVMYLGQAVELAEKEDLFEHPLHPYTQALMQAVPIPDPREQDQCKVLEGEIPSPMDLPSGCPFCARCKKALAICKEIRPQMAETADGHQVACHLYTDGGKQ